MAILISKEIGQIRDDARKEASTLWYDDNPRGELKAKWRCLEGFVAWHTCNKLREAQAEKSKGDKPVVKTSVLNGGGKT